MAIERTSEHKGIARLEPSLFTNPFAAMRRLSDEMERMVEGFGGSRRTPSFWRGLETGAGWMPDIEMFERAGALVIRTDLPGLKKGDVTVELRDSTLVIEGERKEEQERKEKGYYTCERSYGAFRRTVPLPEGVKGEDAKASFKDGVLEITMPAPKLPETHGRRLEIAAS